MNALDIHFRDGSMQMLVNVDFCSFSDGYLTVSSDHLTMRVPLVSIDWLEVREKPLCHSRASAVPGGRGGSCRLEPIRRYAPQGRLRDRTPSRGQAQPAKAPSAAEGEGTTAAPGLFTSFRAAAAAGLEAKTRDFSQQPRKGDRQVTAGEGS